MLGSDRHRTERGRRGFLQCNLRPRSLSKQQYLTPLLHAELVVIKISLPALLAGILLYVWMPRGGGLLWMIWVKWGVCEVSVSVCVVHRKRTWQEKGSALTWQEAPNCKTSYCAQRKKLNYFLQLLHKNCTCNLNIVSLSLPPAISSLLPGGKSPLPVSCTCLHFSHAFYSWASLMQRFTNILL